MYSISAFGSMISSKARMRAYAGALEASISEGDVVVDVGCGTGIFSLLACKFGASRVYAIEAADAISVAQAAARANGFQDRIVFIQDLSTKVSLPELADVVISDLRGVLPFFGQNIPSVIDARDRLIAPGGALIAESDTLWAALVQSPEAFDRMGGPWADNEFGFDLSGASRCVFNTWGKAIDAPHRLLSQPQELFHLDYLAVTSPSLSSRVTLEASSAGVAHGFFVWFDAKVGHGLGFSNAPGVDDSLYGRGYFPWPEAVALQAGDSVTIEVRADLVGPDYIWTWNSDISRRDEPDLRFRQSTFFGLPISPARARKRASDYRPRMGAKGEIDLQILQMMDGRRDLAEIARALRQAFPDRFESFAAALDRVADVAETYD